MTMLWLVFIILILVSIAVVLLPFLRNDASEATERVDYDIVVYRSQLAEIDQEIESGLLTPDQADAARAEVHRRMLAAEDAELVMPSVRVADRRYRLAAVIGFAVILPVGAAALYGVLGSPNLPGKPYAWRVTHDPEFVTASSADKLATLLQESPTAAGYKQLAAMYFNARDYDKAADADRHAIALGATDSATWSELGESVVMANGGAVVPEAMMAFANALGADPRDPRARFYVGLAESQIGNLKQAVGIWRDLEKDGDPNASWRQLVDAHIAAVAKQGGFDVQSVPPQAPSVQALKMGLKAMTTAEHTESSMGGQQAQAAPQTQPSARSDDHDTSIPAMVERFAARMQSNPNDVAGWQRLAHFYVVLGEHAKARAAAEHALRLKPGDVGVLLSVAETQRASAAPGDEIPADYASTMRQVLRHDPANVQALYSVGLAEEKAGRREQARLLWSKALKLAAANDPLALKIHGKLDGMSAAH
jgi:cytochrome c-type biogenesis protein CcmH